MHRQDMAISLVALFHTPSLLLITLLLPLFLLLLFFTKKPLAHNNGRRLPPSPRGFPILGHLPLLGSLPHRSLRALAAVYGPVMLLRFGSVPTVVVSSAAAAQEVMKTRDLAFASRPKLRIGDRLLYGTRDVAFTPYGEYWRQGRRICVLHLLSLRQIRSFCLLRDQEVAILIDTIYNSAKAGAGAGMVNLSELLISYTNSVISRATFGRAYSMKEDGMLMKVFADFGELFGATSVGEFVPWLGWVDRLTGLEGKVTRTFHAMDDILQKAIDDHRRRQNARKSGGEDDHLDVVDVLLDVNEMDKEAGFQLHTSDIKAIILDMFAAGTDTSYTVMEWTMAELIAHPHEMKKLQEEVRTVVGKDKCVTEHHLERMAYLKVVIKEIFRLHTPLPLLLPRETLEDTELSGYHIPARTRVVVNGWAIGRDPKSWERAEEFWPERFVGSSTDYKGQDFELIPFGAGRRGCPGMGFAIPTIELALASLLYHFDWELPEGRKPESLHSEAFGLSVHLESGLVLVAKPWIG